MASLSDLRSRRSVIAASLGGLGALALEAVGRAAPVRAADGVAVVLGDVNQETNETRVVNSLTNGLVGSSGGDGAGVIGESASGPGVVGFGVPGMRGISGSGNGVEGQSLIATASGVYGFSLLHGYGVAGRTNAGPLVSGAGAAGVLGDNSSNGVGVWARSADGIGLLADAVNSDAIALKAQGTAQFAGRTEFSRSGRASVPINRSYVDVAVPGGLASSAGVLAMLQYPRSGAFVMAVRPNYPTTGKARIYLNKVASTVSSTPVAWFVLG